MRDASHRYQDEEDIEMNDSNSCEIHFISKMTVRHYEMGVIKKIFRISNKCDNHSNIENTTAHRIH